MYRLIRKLRRLALFDAPRRWLLIEAALRLVAAYLALKLVPFSRLALHIGTFAPATSALHPASDPAIGEEARARAVGWAVTRVARHFPGIRFVCLPQAIAAQRMLRRRGIASVMYFGGRQDPVHGFQAHAWVQAATVEVTGYPEAHEFTPISRVT